MCKKLAKMRRFVIFASLKGIKKFVLDEPKKPSHHV